MKIPYRILLVTILSIGLLSPTVTLLAADTKLTMEQRLARLERILRNQSLADIILQLQQLQQEVQQLRGEVELQNHTLDALNKRQRDLYLDIDQRLARMQPSSMTPSVIPSVGLPSQPETAPKQESGGLVAAQPDAVSEPVQVSAPKSPPDPKKEAAVYQQAFNLLKQGRYPESIQAFKGFLKDYSGGNYEDNAQYWLGEASYVSRDYSTALTEFTKVIEHYPSSSKVPGALLKSGYIQYEKRDWTKARELFKRVKQDYAGSTEARLADKRLQRMDKEGH